jgi:hypothetical protein
MGLIVSAASCNMENNPEARALWGRAFEATPLVPDVPRSDLHLMRTTVLPPPPTRVGKRGSARFPTTGRRAFTITGEIRRRAPNDPTKLLVLDRLCWDHTGATELRIACYIVGKKGRARGRWVWGQYATMVRAVDLGALMCAAVRRGWIRPTGQGQ